MLKKDISKLIDHAVLNPTATDQYLISECEKCKKYDVASICVKPCHVQQAVEALKDTDIKISTVIGFPHGTNTTKVKIEEAIEAINDGASELDMVINIGKFMTEDYDYVQNEIKLIADTCHSNSVMLKVIIEACLLTEDQITKACSLAEAAGADYVKTSTGFNGEGAKLEDIELMKKSVSDKVKIKASGGIRTWDDAVKFAKAGCHRLGTSSTAIILK